MTTTEPATATETPAASPPAFDVTIHLKGGTSFTIRLAEWTMSRTRLNDEPHSISWESIAGHPRLRYLNIGSIAAVLVADVASELAPNVDPR